MTRQRSFKQVDVFTAEPYRGNPVAVVFDADDIADRDMQRIAHWTNLSETTFLLQPNAPGADYRVRIFTPGSELPFAGHPTLGTCHAWLEAGGKAKQAAVVVQECGVGLVPLRHHRERLAFAAPPLLRGGPVAEADIERACRVLAIERSAVIDARWADNGPGWLAVMLHDADAVLAVQPDFAAVKSYGVGIVGPHPLGVVGRGAPQGGADSQAPAIEVRAFFRAGGVATEDPVTGSLNAALAQWLLGEALLSSPYVAAQGTAVGRSGRVYIEQDGDTIWVGGDAVTCIDGSIRV